MCTRFFIEKNDPEIADIIKAASRSALAERFLKELSKPLRTSGPVRPSEIAAAAAPGRNGRTGIFPMKWGFTTSGRKQPVVNARVETAKDKPMFRDPWREHRCAIPASFYYEWEHFIDGSGKTRTGDRYIFRPRGASITWLCGLYRFENGLPVFAVITRDSAGACSEIHDRMPLILPKEKIGEWVSPDTDPQSLLPFVLTEMEIKKDESQDPSRKDTADQQLSFL